MVGTKAKKTLQNDLQGRFFEEVLRARTRVYHVGNPTPLQPLSCLDGQDFDIFIKREDLGPINAYKWRGAYNATLVHQLENRSLENKGSAKSNIVVAASAGNHAQGVALAARSLGVQARIFMPLSTPIMKQVAVQRHGGDSVEIVLTGDTYDTAAAAAREFCEGNGHIYIHPFDDIYTIAGQATIADEIVLSEDGPFDLAFVQIGGGGMAAGVSGWLKLHHPDIKIIGVEGKDQASMRASFDAGRPVTLDHVDTFCDGTAVTRPGDLCFELCQRNIDDIITVSNEEVSAAIQHFWEGMRVIPEPSGAMGLAGLVQYAQTHPQEVRGKKLLAILCGANMDFGKLSLIAAKSAIGAHRRRYLRFHLGEEKGGLLSLLDSYFDGISVCEFLYGKVDKAKAWPVIALEADPDSIEALEKKLTKASVIFDDVTLDPDTRYRIINYNPGLFQNPLLMHVHFPERKGALRDFLRIVSKNANVCYFNYAYSGESIGRALMGFEFESAQNRQAFLDSVSQSTASCRPVDEKAAARILQQ